MNSTIYNIILWILDLILLAGLILVTVGLIQLVLNKLKTTKYKALRNVSIGLLISIISLILFFVLNNVFHTETLIVPVSNKVNTYHDFRVPAKLSDEEVTNSLMDGQTISIKTKDACVQIEEMAKLDGWEVIAHDVYMDGGSASTAYFKTKDKPAVSVFCRWDTIKGGYSSVNLKFIHPAFMEKWLKDIQTDREMQGILGNGPID